MVPAVALALLDGLRFPRASGDGPFAATAPGIRSRFPPRERGWSHRKLMQRGGSAVSPARAGMVPRQDRGRGPPRGFPRASGDGPSTDCQYMLDPLFPPRERGWSLQVAPVGQLLEVSPARAGMVPRPGRRHATVLRFPRASGDGPSRANIWRCPRWFPPRERGWSLDCKVCMCTGCVSPARAGMVPHLGKEMSVYKGFPRASGDGPVIPLFPVSAF